MWQINIPFLNTNIQNCEGEPLLFCYAVLTVNYTVCRRALSSSQETYVSVRRIHVYSIKIL